MLVVDASAAVALAGAIDGFAILGEEALVAPPLMWSESRASLHQGAWRGEISPAEARAAIERIESGPIQVRNHERLGREAWQIADDFGWAKTYDAEYLALARLLGCRLVTLDARLRRAADRLGFVIGFHEL